jgi:PH (Pleckstrin Homology) domain-containing protein/putative oligomerization/nucleic acid binding protein
MGFADSLLSTGERIMHREKQHWFVFVWGARFTILALIVGLILGVISAGQGPGTLRDVLGIVTLVIFVVGLAVLLWTVLHYLNQEYVITNRRVLQVSGVLNKSSSDSSLEKINDARLEQSFFGRIFGFGDLDVMTAAEVGIERFRMIKDPIEFKKAMLDAKHEFEIDMERQSWPPSPPVRSGEGGVSSSPGPESPTTSSALATSAGAPAAPAGIAPAPSPGPTTPLPRDLSPDEVTRTLANLADLRDRGAISLEEYEAKKADLLGRI